MDFLSSRLFWLVAPFGQEVAAPEPAAPSEDETEQAFVLLRLGLVR